MNTKHLANLIREIELICLYDFRSKELNLDYTSTIRRLLSSATYRLSKVGVFANEVDRVKSIKTRSGRIDFLVDLLPRLYALEGENLTC